MSAMNSRIIFVLFFFITLVSVIKGYILNKNVERNIDLTSQLAKHSIQIIAEESTGALLTEYVLIVPPGESENVAFISVKDANEKELTIREDVTDTRKKFIVVFKVPAPVQALSVDLVFTKSVIPHPEEIRQTDKQLVKYNGQLHFYSPYKTITQKTLVKVSSSNIISNSQLKPFSVSGNIIKYGPYENIAEFSNQTLFVHYENQTPFLTVNSLERTLEVSHWGNIVVKESIHVTHTGAKLKGSFSRYEFQKDGRSGQSAVKSYKTILPASASEIYYRDSNGNISTSNTRILRDFVELELRPRFPLFGGWKTQYTLGYNVPTFEYLFNSGDNYLLKMRVIDHIFDDMQIEKATINIILPEGSANIKLITPYTVKRSADDLVYTYLDSVGRPVITFSKENLVENHIAEFNLKYTFSRTSLLQEPFLVITFIFIIFILTIIFLRLDFSISTHTHKE